jgi:hypothetical protein
LYKTLAGSVHLLLLLLLPVVVVVMMMMMMIMLILRGRWFWSYLLVADGWHVCTIPQVQHVHPMAGQEAVITCNDLQAHVAAHNSSRAVSSAAATKNWMWWAAAAAASTTPSNNRWQWTLHLAPACMPRHSLQASSTGALLLLLLQLGRIMLPAQVYWCLGKQAACGAVQQMYSTAHLCNNIRQLGGFFSAQGWQLRQSDQLGADPSCRDN